MFSGTSSFLLPLPRIIMRAVNSGLSDCKTDRSSALVNFCAPSIPLYCTATLSSSALISVNGLGGISASDAVSDDESVLRGAVVGSILKTVVASENVGSLRGGV